MLSCFDMKPGLDFTSFQADYAAFVDDLMAADIIVQAGPLGARVQDTPMDTDDERSHTHFSILSFRDRAQLDAAYAYIEERRRPSTASHIRMYRQVSNSIFLCWEDLAPGKERT